jgi:hypothetical protein
VIIRMFYCICAFCLFIQDIIYEKMYGLESFKVYEIFPSMLSNLQKLARRNFCVDVWQFVQNLYFGAKNSVTNVICSVC